LVLAWGAPGRSTTLADNREAHTWVSQEPPTYRGGPSVGVGVFGGSGGSGVGVGIGFPIGGSAGSESCERTLVFSERRVVEQTWTGPAGYCARFKK
jgi:hypothetical protein